MKEQRIECNVNACCHNDTSCKCCGLGTIKVVCDSTCPTAHYCSDYKKK